MPHNSLTQLAANGVKDGDLIMAMESPSQQQQQQQQSRARRPGGLFENLPQSTGSTPPDRLPTEQEVAAYRGLRFADIPVSIPTKHTTSLIPSVSRRRSHSHPLYQKAGAPPVTLRNIFHANPDTLLRQVCK